MKKKLFGWLFLFLAITSSAQTELKDVHSLDQMIDNWHLAAAQANFEAYFARTSSNFVFLGTAPGERWARAEFMTFCKPYFDKGKAWISNPVIEIGNLQPMVKWLILTRIWQPGWKAAEEVAFVF